MIITSEKMTAEDALLRYRNRDTTEKQFLTEKSFLGGDTWRVQSDETLESKQLLSFVALVIRNEIFKAMEPLKKRERKKYTVPAVLREMDRIIVTRSKKGVFQPRYALTAYQKSIMKAIGLDEDAVRNELLAVCDRYSKKVT